MVRKSPKDRVVPFPNGLFMPYKLGGDLITTYKSLRPSWEPILQVENDATWRLAFSSELPSFIKDGHGVSRVDGGPRILTKISFQRVFNVGTTKIAFKNSGFSVLKGDVFGGWECFFWKQVIFVFSRKKISQRFPPRNWRLDILRCSWWKFSKSFAKIPKLWASQWYRFMII